ncbi:hypothetical protein ACFYVL_41675 [Streptomyces sp. NPDC004111]|uniref:DUF7660 family protein n=1 Tax=Streptomyces sp. NPDC004111 TaxID=3364690 RepID=UPI003684AB44
MSTGRSNEIRTREELAAFVRDLHEEYLSRGQDWENTNLESFLEALAAWIDSADHLYRNLGEDLPPHGNWSFFARSLGAATMYE